MKTPIPEHKQCRLSDLESQENSLFWLNRAASSRDREELSDLSLTGSEMIRCKVAKNPNASIDTLQLLATDRQPEVRAAVAANPRTPHPTLAKLAHDAESLVRLAVAQSVDTNIELLRELALDEDREVCSAARRTYKQVIAEIMRNQQQAPGHSEPLEKLIA